MIPRRAFLRGVSGAGTAALLGLRLDRAGAEPPPETTRLRLLKTTSMCWAPQFVAEELLKAEGFTDVSYAEIPEGTPISLFLSRDQADISMNFVAPNLIRVDQGDPEVFLAGAHVGCFEVFAGPRVRRISDLKGKTAAVTVLNGSEHVFLASIAAHVGLDPRKDINWVVHESNEGLKLFVDGKVDVYLAFPPLRRAKDESRIVPPQRGRTDKGLYVAYAPSTVSWCDSGRGEIRRRSGTRAGSRHRREGHIELGALRQRRPTSCWGGALPGR